MPNIGESLFTDIRYPSYQRFIFCPLTLKLRTPPPPPLLFLVVVSFSAGETKAEKPDALAGYLTLHSWSFKVS